MKKKKRKAKKFSTQTDLPLIIVDTREQKPYLFRKTKRCRGHIISKLECGDYQLSDCSDLIVIERKKNIDELCSNIGVHRDRFERLLQRMLSFKLRYVVIEDYYSSIYRPRFSKMSPSSIFGSIMSFQVKYNVSFLFCGNRDNARRVTRTLLEKAYKHRKDITGKNDIQ
jgi:ERCC4-type nuclease